MDALQELRPVMLCGLTWAQARSALEAVDCAIRRAHWCSPVVVLIDGELMLDDDGEIGPFVPMPAREGRIFGCGADRAASDWMMVPRVDDDNSKVEPTYRAHPKSVFAINILGRF